MNLLAISDEQERLILAALKVAELNAEAFKDEATRNECGGGAAMMRETSRNFRTLREKLQSGALHAIPVAA